MTLPKNNDFANCELSANELETISGGLGLWTALRNELTGLASYLQVIYANRDHPPLPSGGPGPKGGPYRV